MLGSKKSDKIKQKDAITGALTQLNLPTTKEEFDKYEGPSLYPGANNNKDLELKYAMLGNKKITESLTPGGTPIIAEEAGLDRLKSVRAYMEEVVPEWAQKTADTTLDVNSLLGKFYSYKNNKEGAGNIGLAVKDENDNQKEIFVTGSHYLFCDKERKFVMVKDHPDAILTEEKEDTFSCLITDNHTIPLGGYMFWDWEDDLVPK